jgi:type IV pilus assembly protein PilM
MASRQATRLKDHTVLALDVGSRFIKVAELRLTRGAIWLLNVAARPTPPGVMDSSHILDPVGLGRAVRELLHVSKIRTRKVIVAVRGQSSVVVRPIDLPKMSVKELRESMKYEVERHIPFAVDEVVMDYAPVVDPDLLPETESNMKVLLAVAQEELINAFLKMLGAAGLQPIALDVEILAAMRSLLDIDRDYSQGNPDKATALINIGSSSTDISIITDGDLAFTRTVPIAGDALTEAVADQLGRSFEEAEELKKEYGRFFLDSAIDEGEAVGFHTPPAEEAASDQPFSFFGAFSGVGEETTPAVEQTTPSGSVFSLDDESDFSASSGKSPSAAAPFSLDDDDAPDSGVLRLSEDEPDRPVFSLDLDDDEPDIMSFSLGNTKPSQSSTPAPEPEQRAPATDEEDDTPAFTDFSAASAEALGAGPVFDLSSEIAAQKPPPLSRPAGDAADETPEEPVDNFSAAELLGYKIVVPPTEQDDLFPAPTPSTPTGSVSQTPLQAASSEDEAPEETPAPVGESSFAPFDMEDAAEATTVLATPESDGQTEVFQRRVFESMLPTLVELATEIRRSLEYYSSRDTDIAIEKIILYGGTSRMPYLSEFIHRELGIEVQVADPFESINIESCRQPEEYVRAIAPALPVCIGLGLREMIV